MNKIKTAMQHLRKRYENALGTGCFWDNFIWAPIRVKNSGGNFYED